MQKITFIVDGEKLVGTLLYQEKIKSQNPALLFIHGWASSQEGSIARAEELVKLGFICLTFDLRSHGG